MDSNDVKQLNEAFAKSSTAFQLIREDTDTTNDLYDAVEQIIIAAAHNPDDEDSINSLYQTAANIIRPEYDDAKRADDENWRGGGWVQEWMNETSKGLSEMITFFQEDELGSELGQDLHNYIDTSHIIELATGAAHQYDDRDPTGQDEDQEYFEDECGMKHSDEEGALNHPLDDVQDQLTGVINMLTHRERNYGPNWVEDAKKILGDAVNKIGETLEEIDPGGGGNPDWEKWK